MTRRKLKRRKKKNKTKTLLIVLSLCVVVVFLMGVVFKENFRDITITQDQIPSYVDKQLIVNNTTVEDKNIQKINDIVVHYVANPRSTAQQNRDFFAKPTTHVNAHFVVGINGEIIQCMPLYLMSAASNRRNVDTISIEMCHPDWSGKFTDKTYNSTVKLVAWLCDNYHIGRERVIRHGDITGKNCPKYFMENEKAWEEFKRNVKEY